MSAAEHVACCAFCGDTPKEGERLKACSKCHNVRYCNKDCQRMHWRAGHREHCCATKLVMVAEADNGQVPDMLFGPMSDEQRDVVTESFRTNSKAKRSDKHKSDPDACLIAMNCAMTLALLYQMRNKWAESLGFMDNFDNFLGAYKALVSEGSERWRDVQSQVRCISTNRRMVEAIVFSVKNESAVKQLHATPDRLNGDICKYALADDLLLEQTTWCTLDPGSVAENIDSIIQLGATILNVINGITSDGEHGDGCRKDVMLSQQCIQRTLAIMRSADVPAEYESRARQLKFFLGQEKNFIALEQLLTLQEQVQRM